QRKGANVGAAYRVTRQQSRLGLDLVEVLDYCKRLGDDASRVVQRRHQALWVKSAVGWRIVLPTILEEVHGHRLVGEPLQIEGNAAAIGRGRAEIAVEFEHGTRLLSGGKGLMKWHGKARASDA